MARETARTVIGGILLAAGRGTRSGAPNKLLTPDRDGVAMVCRSAGAMRDSRLDRIRIVLGHQADAVRAVLAQDCPELPVLLAEDHADGLAASLRCGIRAATEDGWAAAVICLADMPDVGAHTIDRLIEAWRGAPPPGVAAVVPLAGGRRGNPVLWDARMFAALASLRGDRGGRDLLRNSPLPVLAVETGDGAVLLDHDTPDALVRFGDSVAIAPDRCPRMP